MDALVGGQSEVSGDSRPEEIRKLQPRNSPLGLQEAGSSPWEEQIDDSETCELGDENSPVHELFGISGDIEAESFQLLQTDIGVLDSCMEGSGEASTSSDITEVAMVKQLIPGLSDDIAILCLARVSRGMVPILSAVCKAWRAVVKAASYPSLRQQVKSSEGWIYVLSETPAGAPFVVFNPRANKWHNLTPTPGHSQQHRWHGFACVALGCCLYLMGGVRQSYNQSMQKWSEGTVSADVKVYNAHTNKWSLAASMHTARSWFAATVIGERLYVAGGQGISHFLNCAEVYDTKEDIWYPIKSMNFIRFSCSGVALDGQFWVVAGEYMRSQYQDRPRKGSAEVYDPQSDSWRVVEEMWLDCHKVPGPNTVIDGKLIFIHYSKIMAYDHETNCWMHLGHVSGGDVYNRPFSRFGFACESLDGDLYILGGARESWQNRNRYHVQTLNTVEACSNLSCRDVIAPHLLQWRQVADLGDSGGTVLASAVVYL